jgi:putative MATE family efflux protein
MKSEEELPQLPHPQSVADIPAEADIPAGIEMEPALVDADRTKLPLMHIAWPLIIENLIRVGITSADVFMLSYYSEEAVAAIGLITQLVFFIVLLYTMVASGASIIISQYLGARDTKAAGRVAQGSIVLSVIFSAVLSVAMCLAADAIVTFYDLPPQVHKYAFQYMVIYAAGSASVALAIILSTIIRSYGHSRGPMLVNLLAMAISVVGNYLFIFGKFGVPKWGVPGVALSTIFSHVVACAILWAMMKKRRDIKLEKGGFFKVPMPVYKQILAVGVPTAGENVCYNIGQIAIMRIIASLGTEAMAAFVYALTVLRFVFITSIAIGSAVQIKVGYYVGAAMADIAQKKVYRYWATGFAISLTLVVAAKIFQVPIIDILTSNEYTRGMVFAMLTIALIHEPGRNFNTIIIPALKGAGDVKFPVYVGMIFMWGVGVTLAYVFGITLGWGLMGICVAMAIDEWSRGLVILWRWRGGRWKTKSLVGKS